MSVLHDTVASYDATDKLKVDFDKYQRAPEAVFLVGCICAFPKSGRGRVSLGSSRQRLILGVI